MKIEDLYSFIIKELEFRNWCTVEEFAAKYGVSNGIIHKVFMKINQLSGWSIRPCNFVPYARKNGLIRNRKKGDLYKHDTAESDWKRTSFEIRKGI